MPAIARRNTIHQHHPCQVETYDVAITNPFSSSLAEERNEFSPSESAHPSSSQQSDQTLQNTNPFVHTPTTYSRDKNGQFLPFPNSSTPSKPARDKSRRMSLDALKAPFGWGRHRRATCTELTPSETKTLQTPLSQSTLGYSREDIEVAQQEEILKTALYHDSARHGRGHDGRYVGQLSEESSSPSSRTSQKAPRPLSYNPFLQGDGNVYPLDQSDNVVTSFLGRKTEREADLIPVKIPARRRHSVFSDWSIEDCPQLLTGHKTQELQEQEPKDMSSSRSSLTRSMTLNSYPDDYQPQHRRHSSAVVQPPGNPASTYRARRNTVVLGRTMTMHSASYIRSPQRFQDSDPWEQRRQDSELLLAKDGYSCDQPVVSVRRPHSTLASLRRRESCSYAQDFASSPGGSISRPPRPWINTCTTRSTSLKSFGSENSPLFRTSSAYSDGLGDEMSTEPCKSKKSSNPYREFQLRPYGYEFEDDDEEEEKTDLDAFAERRRVHAQDQDHASVESNPCSAIEDDQVYYNALARQLTCHPYDDDEDFDIHRDGFSHLQHHGKDSIFRRSNGSLTKGFQASFYKLMASHQNEADDHDYDHQQHEDDSGSRSFRSRLGGVSASSFSFTGSAHSFTSSFRARVRLTRTKTVLQQVKKKISNAARTVLTEANKAAQGVGPLLSKRNTNDLSRSKLRTTQAQQQQSSAVDEYNPSLYDEDAEPYYDPLMTQPQPEHDKFQHRQQKEPPNNIDNRQERHTGR
ncbi:hypothetical protein EMPS_08052 [Entomortierella parvispora]|uniref:Uncharacterized protein n=1 Tax=Entomortierella parvispora TaxID=205924 RepID=A0A9P3HFC4_9FUNG|nr:hypothetical protein EMPS_08052 [Entomortierella parvispora]